MKQDFWEKASQCDHDWSPVYYEFIPCPTPYCNGGETHCLKCLVFEVTCQCGFCNSMSGWPEARNRAIQRRRERKRAMSLDDS